MYPLLLPLILNFVIRQKVPDTSTVSRMKVLLTFLLTPLGLLEDREIASEELLQARRVTDHIELFREIDKLFADNGIRPAKYIEIDDPTVHLNEERITEWTYYIQPIDGLTRNEIFIGLGPEKVQLISKTEVVDFCDCKSLIAQKGKELDKIMKDLNSLIDNHANKSRDQIAGTKGAID